MDIPALSIGLSQTQFQQEASVAIMKMAMDNTKINAQGLTELLSQKNIELSIKPNLGGHLDIRI